MPIIASDVPPLLLEASLASDGSPTIVLTFGPWPTNRAGFNGLAECDALLATSTTQLLRGSETAEPSCVFTDDYTLQIRLTRRTAVGLGDVLWLRSPGLVGPRTITGCPPSTDGAYASLCASGNATLTLPQTAAPPVARLVGPRLLSVCDGIELSGLTSTGGGVLPRRFVWNVSSADATPAELAPLEAALGVASERIDAGASLEASRLTLTAPLLPSGRTLLFQLTVRSELGGASAPALLEVRPANASATHPQLQPPPAHCLTARPRTARPRTARPRTAAPTRWVASPAPTALH